MDIGIFEHIFTHITVAPESVDPSVYSDVQPVSNPSSSDCHPPSFCTVLFSESPSVSSRRLAPRLAGVVHRSVPGGRQNGLSDPDS